MQETEVTTDTLMRAFSTSAMGIKDETERKRVFDQLEQLFNNTGGTEVYRGYVDDPRNTDNAWLETIATWFHCPADLGGKIEFQANNSAKQVMWVPIGQGKIYDLDVYANHRDIVEKVLWYWRYRVFLHGWIVLPAVAVLAVAIALLVVYTA